jgi:PPK2 family polyphosphate:nucleotide phosphotransferase
MAGEGAVGASLKRGRRCLARERSGAEQDERCGGAERALDDDVHGRDSGWVGDLQSGRRPPVAVSVDLPPMPSLKPVAPGSVPELADSDARLADAPPKQELRDQLAAMGDELDDLQTRLFAGGTRGLIVVLQARDAGGKDGVVRHVFGLFNPQGIAIRSFGVPTPAELSHDYLWRVHAAVGPRGTITVFNRSQYEDVLVVRVHGLVPEAMWRARYAQINAFEAMLGANGYTILKFFLHVSRDEQRERLEARLDDPAKNWKFRAGDLEERARWDEYTRAYQEMLSRCSTPEAPWFVVPADSKPMRDLLIAQTIRDALKAMNLQYPPADPAVLAWRGKVK